MAQTHLGAMKLLAKKIGLSLEELLAKKLAGLKWCMGCREWHAMEEFGIDSTRYDGRVPCCRAFKNARVRLLYKPRAVRCEYGPARKPSRDGDKRQARHHVNLSVRAGRIDRPNSLPCFDCGHIYRDGGPRHEYDHYLGYEAVNHYKIQVVCVSCHHRREAKRVRRSIPWAKLNNSIVALLRGPELHTPNSELRQKYGVSRETIRRAQKGICWRQD